MNKKPDKKDKKPYIFGIGLAKTGTNSLIGALNQLGFTGKHMGADWRDSGPGLTEYFLDAADAIDEGKEDDILAKASGCDAVADWPIPAIYKQIDKQYPDSKFILTYRNPHDATLSYMRMTYATWDQRSKLPSHRTGKVHRPTYEKQLAHHLRHLDEVFDYFWGREDKFIVIDTSKGKSNWKILCEFLGIDSKPWRQRAWPHHYNHLVWYGNKLKMMRDSE